MKKVLIVLLVFVFSAFAGLDIGDFQAYVDAKVPKSRFGLSIRSVKTGQELAGVRSDEMFTPASTLKTLTTATALHYLPLDFAPQTYITLNGSLEGKTFKGEVVVRGQGDPNYSSRYYPDPLYVLHTMADSIRALGIDTIEGRLTLDSSYFKGPWKPKHWKPSHFNTLYGVEVAPMEFNDNYTVLYVKPGEAVGDSAIVRVSPDVGYVVVNNGITTAKYKKKSRAKWKSEMNPDSTVVTLTGEIDLDADSVQIAFPIRNPVLYFGAALKTAIADKEITLVENADVPVGSEYRKFAFSAAPMLSMVDEINQKSNNMFAETLFRIIGAELAGEGSAEGGKEAERKLLDEIGIDHSDFEVYDGCGLSHKNLVKPSSETKLLAFMARDSIRGRYYMNSFASPGVGSGSTRMKNLQTPWLVCFKTGTINGVFSLAGYIITMDGDTLAVAMYLNEASSSGETCRNVIDSLWMRIIGQVNDHYASLMEMKALWLTAKDIKDFPSRLDYFSKALIGKPYLLGPMGESYLDTVDTKPLVNMDSVDCLTYIEHALAMALAPSEDSIFSIHQRIRYFDGEINFSKRKHYLLGDWVGEDKFARVIPLDGQQVMQKTLPKNEFFAAKELPYLQNGKPAADPKISFQYLPFDAAVKLMSKPYQGPLLVTGVAFISKSAKVDAYHTGFVVFRPGELPVVRHASSIMNQVIELPLHEYIANSKGKLPGITLFEFLPQ